MYKYIKYLIVFIVFTILVCFQSICAQYFFKQKLISLESNHLLSNAHLNVSYNQASSSAQRIQTELEKESYWMFEMVDIQKQNTIYAITGTNYDDLVLPIYNGKYFENVSSKEAIIGYEVKTISINEKEYIHYNNQDYLVIGRMGIMNPSPLSNTILINDESLFYRNESGDILFDSSDTNKLKELQNREQLTNNNNGIGRWFDIETYLNFMKWFSILLCASISCIIGITYRHVRTPFNNLKYELGVSMNRCIIRDIVFMLLSYSLLFMCSNMLIVQINTSTLNTLIIYVLVSILMMLFGYLIGSPIGIRGKKS